MLERALISDHDAMTSFLQGFLELPTLRSRLRGAVASGDDEAVRNLLAEGADVGRELPTVLTRIREAGGQISDVEVRAPSLHSVFIHLTGRELRE